ncbi:MAG: YhcH/YjgK/YiaL family protein [Cardiobacteriaceae bacterium]|nr:YhcH/YjgK/YiaL family protein [Cardiobacteriaceae bacterium]
MELVDYAHKVTGVSPVVSKVLDFLKTQSLADLPDGHHAIEDEDFFVNIFRYSTAAEDERIWEAHRDYIDVQLVLEGHEIAQQAFISECQQGVYDAERDYVPIVPPSIKARFVLGVGQLAVFYPEDAHQTGVLTGAHAEDIRKAVFKVRV